MKWTFDPSLPGRSWLEMFLEHLRNAFFIAIFVGGFAIGFFSEQHFRLAARIVCPPGASLSYHEEYDGESTAISGYCIQPGGEPEEKTLEVLGVTFAMYYLVFFLPPAAAGTAIRLIRKAEEPPG